MHTVYPLYDRSGVDDDDNVLPSTQGSCVEADVPAKPDAPAKPLGRGIKLKAGLILGCLALVLLTSLLLLVAVGAMFPAIISPGLLALTFGLRHAVDADHIAAIDNVTRKLVEDGQMPLTVGLFFSLGHSTVVVIMCIIVAWSSGYAADRIPDFARAVGLWGASFSSTVLLLFAFFNGWTAIRLFRKFRQLRREGATEMITHEHDEEGQHSHAVSVVADDKVRVEGPGCLTKSPCCKLIFNSIDRPWKLYPVGFLFGLGFDTATEISLLAVTATMGASESGLPWSVTLLLPLLFTAGMSFIDTLDSVFMLWAYGWASLDLTLQTWFNFSLTAISSFIALAIAVIQVLGILQEEFELTGGFWVPVVAVGEHSDVVGGCIVAIFVLSLAIATIYAQCLRRPSPGQRNLTGNATEESHDSREKVEGSAAIENMQCKLSPGHQDLVVDPPEEPCDQGEKGPGSGAVEDVHFKPKVSL
eukprot:TRINITY_DN78685_c0_g1_i1.p1 TRINITY_DN78685_c0_g1~~TRINITY_DN78685_c0_g1_i1.p1  ORF type:complete len:473 (+),score=89.28 TRINITY_DN78685_c0_g1_i1:65-1483(+)